MHRSALVFAGSLLVVLLAGAGARVHAVAGEEPGAPEGQKKQEKQEKKELSAEERKKLAHRIETLVKELGHDAWAAREAAAAALLKIGAPAEEALERATCSKDLETATRAHRLLLAIRGAGFIGIYIADGPESAEEGSARGSLVTNLVREAVGGPTSLQAGDVIVAVNGKRVDGWPDLQKFIARCRPGSTAKLRVRREEKILELTVKVERWPEDEFPLPEIPD